jgi:nicotinamidase-related amidase
MNEFPHPGPALIVIDVQRAFDEWEAAGQPRNNPDAIRRIAELLAAFREQAVECLTPSISVHIVAAQEC